MDYLKVESHIGVLLQYIDELSFTIYTGTSGRGNGPHFFLLVVNHAAGGWFENVYINGKVLFICATRLDSASLKGRVGVFGRTGCSHSRPPQEYSLYVYPLEDVASCGTFLAEDRLRRLYSCT